MNDNMFRTHVEQKKNIEFDDIIKELKVFASNKYVKHIDYLNTTFKDISEPNVENPDLAGKKIS